jgi:hypothetical protein
MCRTFAQYVFGVRFPTVVVSNINTWSNTRRTALEAAPALFPVLLTVLNEFCLAGLAVPESMLIG